MNIDELIKERLNMEERIRAFVSQQVSDFQSASGVKVGSVSVDLIDDRKLSEKRGKSIVYQVDVGVEI